MATHFNRPSTLGGAASKERSPRINFAPMRERLTKPFRAPEPEDQRDERWIAFAREAEQEPVDEVLPRFPIVRQGYDCLAVDGYITELERELAETDRELAEVRGQAQSADEVNQELKRIGEQTSAVLIAAHEQHDEIVRAAREEADRLVSDATAQAGARATEAETRLRALQAQNEATRRERERLFDDIRTASAALNALVDSRHEQTAPQA